MAVAAPPSVDLSLANQQRAVLNKIIANTSGSITDAFAGVISDVMPSAARFRDAYGKELQRLQDTQAAFTEEGEEDVPPAKVSLIWLYHSGFLDELLRSINEATEKAAQAAQAAAIAAQVMAWNAGRKTSASMVAKAAGVHLSQVNPATGGTMPPDEGVDETVDLPSNTTNNVRKGLIAGVAAGLAGQALLQGVQMAIQEALSEMLGMGRNAAVDTMRQSMLMTIQNNGTLVNGWIWTASGGACIACLEMDGSVHGWDEDMESHNNCACLQVPYSGPPIDDLATGEDYFNALDDAAQEEILGPAKYMAWQQGDIQLMDLLSTEGGYVHERSLKSLGLDFRDYLQQLPTKGELREIPEIGEIHGALPHLSEEEFEHLVAYAPEMPAIPELPSLGEPGNTMGYDIVDKGGAGAARLQELVGHDMTPDEIGRMVGAQEGNHLLIEPYHENAVFIRFWSGDYKAERALYRDSDGLLVMSNDNIKIENPALRGQGLGSKIFGEEVQNLSAMGVDRIETGAAGSAAGLTRNPESANGFITWARLGYQTNLKDLVDEGLDLEALQREFPGVETLQDLMMQPGGPEYWRANGVSFRGTFDLKEGSTSRWMLDQYLQAKGIEIEPVVAREAETLPSEAATRAVESGTFHLHDLYLATKDLDITSSTAGIRAGSYIIHDETEGKVSTALARYFGHDVTTDDLAELVGAQPGDHIVMTEYGTRGAYVDLALHSASWDPESGVNSTYDAYVELERTSKGLVMHDNALIATADAPDDIAARVLATQLQKLDELGVTRVEINEDWWRSPGNLQSPEHPARFLQQEVVHAPLSGLYDLTPGSEGRQAIEDYLREQGIELPASTTAATESPAIQQLRADREALQTQRDALQAKQDVLSEKWRSLVLKQAELDPEEEQAAIAKMEKQIARVEKQQGNNIAKMDKLEAKIAKIDAKLPTAPTPEVAPAPEIPAPAPGGEGAKPAYTLPEIDQEAEQAVISAAQDALAGDGVASHADAMDLGTQMDSYLDDRIGPLADYAREAYAITEPGAELTPEQEAWLKGDLSQHGGLTARQAEEQYQAAMRDETVRLVDEVRGVGGDLTLADGADEAVESALDQIQQLLPSDWIEASNSQGLLKLEGDAGEKMRGYYNATRGGGGIIALRTEGQTADDLATAIAHEAGHRLEDSTNGIWLLEKELYNARTAGEDFVDLDGVFLVPGRTKEDEWALQYMGKEPILVQRGQGLDASGQKLRSVYHYELLSVGLEWLLGNDVRGQYFLAKDPEFRQWLLGVLFGAKDHVV